MGIWDVCGVMCECALDGLQGLPGYMSGECGSLLVDTAMVTSVERHPIVSGTSKRPSLVHDVDTDLIKAVKSGCDIIVKMHIHLNHFNIPDQIFLLQSKSSLAEFPQYTTQLPTQSYIR